MKYRYDLHCHCSEGSACSLFPIEDMVKFYIQEGLDGFCLTDHFSADPAFRDNIPWKERIDLYFSCYEKALRAAEGTNLKVFTGLEFGLLRNGTKEILNCTGNEFLIFGLTKEWLRENEAAFNLPYGDFLDAIRNAGAFVIHAHPFRERPYIDSIMLFPRKVDAVEIINGGNTWEENERAKWYANEYGLLQVAGSDIHTDEWTVISGVETEKKCETIYDLIDEIKRGRTKIFSQKASRYL